MEMSLTPAGLGYGVHMLIPYSLLIGSGFEQSSPTMKFVLLLIGQILKFIRTYLDFVLDFVFEWYDLNIIISIQLIKI